MNKVMNTIAAGGMLLMMATPAFAFQRNYTRGSVNTNTASIDSMIVTSANTGLNTQGNSVAGDPNQVASLSIGRFGRYHGSNDVDITGNNVLNTGVALATTTSHIIANSTNCGCAMPEVNSQLRHSYSSTPSVRNTATVISTIQTDANTGSNQQGNYVFDANGSGDITIGGNNTTTTGPATADTNSMIVVNSTWSM